MEKRIENLISNKDELLSAIEISNALTQTKTNVLLKFWDCLRKEMSAKKMKLVWESEHDINESFYQKSSIPCLTYFIRNFDCSTYGKVTIVMEIYIETQLEYAILYYNKNNECINNNNFNNHKYDFKHFSQNCCNLIEDDVCQSEAERISMQMTTYIKSLKKELTSSDW